MIRELENEALSLPVTLVNKHSGRKVRVTGRYQDGTYRAHQYNHPSERVVIGANYWHCYEIKVRKSGSGLRGKA